MHFVRHEIDSLKSYTADSSIIDDLEDIFKRWHAVGVETRFSSAKDSIRLG